MVSVFEKIIRSPSSEFGTYRLCEQRRFRRACTSAQSRQNLHCSLIQEEPSDRKPDPWPLWMAGHAQLKFVMTECSKTQIRLTGLIKISSHCTTKTNHLSFWFDFCFTALQHILGHFERGQLPNPHCSWASLLGSLPVLSAHSFASNWQLLFLNPRKRENGRRNESSKWPQGSRVNANVVLC